MLTPVNLFFIRLHRRHSGKRGTRKLWIAQGLFFPQEQRVLARKYNSVHVEILSKCLYWRLMCGAQNIAILFSASNTAQRKIFPCAWWLFGEIANLLQVLDMIQWRWIRMTSDTHFTRGHRWQSTSLGAFNTAWCTNSAESRRAYVRAGARTEPAFTHLLLSHIPNKQLKGTKTISGIFRGTPLLHKQ